MAGSDGTRSGSSTYNALILSVEQDGTTQEVFLQHGLSLGRNPSNTVTINAPEVERIHAMVLRNPDGNLELECQGDQAVVCTPDGAPLRRLMLHDGVAFRLGPATLRCCPPRIPVVADPWKTSCPRCRADLSAGQPNTAKCPQCALPLLYVAPPAPAADDAGRNVFWGWLPAQVGPYSVRTYVAHGGMGLVLRAMGPQDRPAAVKLLRATLDPDSHAMQRFTAEANTLRPLRHPNLVLMQDQGRDGGLVWLAMDWVDGQTVAELLAQRLTANQPLAIPEIADIMLQMCKGLAYLHGRQIVHRDLKPGNLLVARDGTVKIADVGIAKVLAAQAQTTTTQTGTVMGTQAYMPPEQMDGRPATFQSDIYSLGMIWYELLTGRLARGRFAPPGQVRRDCPPAWNQTILNCLSEMPHDRPTLTAIVQCLEHPEEPVSQGTPARRPRPASGATTAPLATASPAAKPGAARPAARSWRGWTLAALAIAAVTLWHYWPGDKRARGRQQYAQGMKALKANKTAVALTFFKRAAGNGCVRAMYRVGKYYSGEKGEPAQKLARKYLSRAAKHGSARAMVLLGNIDSLTNPLNMGPALALWHKAAAKGNAAAMLALSTHDHAPAAYYTPLGNSGPGLTALGMHPQKALAWLRRAAQSPATPRNAPYRAKAMLQLGDAYRYGMSGFLVAPVQINDLKARKWYAAATKAGAFIWAQWAYLNLGLMSGQTQDAINAFQHAARFPRQHPAFTHDAALLGTSKLVAARAYYHLYQIDSANSQYITAGQRLRQAAIAGWPAAKAIYSPPLQPAPALPTTPLPQSKGPSPWIGHP